MVESFIINSLISDKHSPIQGKIAEDSRKAGRDEYLLAQRLIKLRRFCGSSLYKICVKSRTCVSRELFQNN